jgi:hypothetical protein
MTLYAITTIKRFTGLSTDTKPTDVPVGSTFYEYDTNILWITYDGTNWLPKDIRSFTQSTTVDLHQVAGDYTLYTATTGFVYVESFSLTLPNVDCSDDATITSIKVETDTSPAVTLVSAVQGAVANLTANKAFSYSTPFILDTTKVIQLTIAGGASDAATVCTVKCRYSPVIPGAYLAI